MSSPVPPSPNSEGDRGQVELADGTVAQLLQDAAGWSLQINGIRQSHVGAPDVPPALAASRWLLAALGSQLPRRSAHLGGGLLTLPRIISARRPGAAQVVVELEPALVHLAREKFGVPAGVDLRLGDARQWLEATTSGAEAGPFDAVVVDIFAGGRIPPAFTSLECFAQARDALAADGVLVINSVAGPELDFTRRELATLLRLFEHVGMIVQGSALHGARFGNAVLIGSASPLDTEAIRTALSGDSSRGALVTDLAPIVDHAQPIRDDEQIWSPEPDLPQLGEMLKALDGIEAMRSNVQQAFGKEN